MGGAKVQYISFNTSGRDLPDISALGLGCCAPSGVVGIYLANLSLLCYITYTYIKMSGSEL